MLPPEIAPDGAQSRAPAYLRGLREAGFDESLALRPSCERTMVIVN